MTRIDRYMAVISTHALPVQRLSLKSTYRDRFLTNYHGKWQINVDHVARPQNYVDNRTFPLPSARGNNITTAGLAI